MRFLTVEQMRAADAAAVNECGIPEQMLMNRAGSAVARAVAQLARRRGCRRILLLAGHGNNGGDTCVAARCLHRHGFSVHLIMTCEPSSLRGAARMAWEAIKTAQVANEVVATERDWRENPDLISATLLIDGIVVDGILGTGCRGAPHGVAAEAVRWINAMRSRALVVSVDLPSGMNGDSGLAAGDVVRADLTVTFAAPKSGFASQAAMPLLGHLLVADIGIPEEITERGDESVDMRLITQPEITSNWPVRDWAGHKGSYGHLCVIGGASPYPNAPVLSCAAALRCGTGLVSLRSCSELAHCALALIPEVIAEPLQLESLAVVDEKCCQQLVPLNGCDVAVAGPGLGRSEGAAALVRYLLRSFNGWLVLDADALNLLAEFDNDHRELRAFGRVVLTPHPGEAARLLRCTVADVQSDRCEAVRQLAQRFNAVAVLKGAGTLVSDGSSRPLINLTGNPGMASGGTGDVLTGVIGALLAQGFEGVQAVATAVWLHGTAGDLAALSGSQCALTAWELVRLLPSVLRQVER